MSNANLAAVFTGISVAGVIALFVIGGFLWTISMLAFIPLRVGIQSQADHRHETTRRLTTLPRRWPFNVKPRR